MKNSDIVGNECSTSSTELQAQTPMAVPVPGCPHSEYPWLVTPDMCRIPEHMPEPLEPLVCFKDKPVLRKQMVGTIVGDGDVGKTRWCLCAAWHWAAGKPYGGLKPARPLKSLLLLAEDPETEVQSRIWAIKNAFGAGDVGDRFNAHSILGKTGPLAKVKSDLATPETTEHYAALEKTLENFPGLDLLWLDTKSRLYGLAENSNEHNAFFVHLLERLSVRFGPSIIVNHHVSKASNYIAKQHMNTDDARGGKAFTDNCRFVAGIMGMTKNERKDYETHHNRYVSLEITKNNYGYKPKGKKFWYELELDELGRDIPPVLVGRDLENDKLCSNVGFLVRALEKVPNIGKRDLARGTEKGEHAEFFKALDDQGITGKARTLALDMAIKMGFVAEVETKTDKPGANPKYLKVVKPLPELGFVVLPGE